MQLLYPLNSVNECDPINKPMEYKSRRHFIKGMAISGAATLVFAESHLLASHGLRQRHHTLRAGSVILFQGDSITDGNRGRTADLNHIMGHGYAFGLASRLGADYAEKGLVFYNRGISGNKINDLANRWQSDTMDLKPDLLSILIGVNDTASVVFHREPIISAEKYKEIYRSLLDQTLKQFPDLVFVLCEPFILKVGKVKDNWENFLPDLKKRQEAVASLAMQYDAVFVGFQEVFNKACERASAEYWMWDGIHPTVAGHELMAREWLRQVEKRIKF